jgi:hypothetical protein
MNHYLLLLGSLVNRFQAFQNQKIYMNAFFHWSIFLQILGDVIYNLITLKFLIFIIKDLPNDRKVDCITVFSLVKLIEMDMELK